MYDMAKSQNWVVISMKNDWRIFASKSKAITSFDTSLAVELGRAQANGNSCFVYA